MLAVNWTGRIESYWIFLIFAQANRRKELNSTDARSAWEACEIIFTSACRVNNKPNTNSIESLTEQLLDTIPIPMPAIFHGLFAPRPPQ